MELLFLNFLLIWSPLGYILLFLGMLFEGDLFLFTAAFLTSAGLFDVGDALMTALAGVLIGDFLWYEAGKHFHRLPVFITSRVERLAAPFDKKLAVRPFRTIFLTKFAYGIHHLVLLRSGTIRLSLIRFLKSDIPASLIWLTIVGGLGYFSGYSSIGKGALLKYGEIGILIGLVVIFFAERLITRFSKRK